MVVQSAELNSAFSSVTTMEVHMVKVIKTRWVELSLVLVGCSYLGFLFRLYHLMVQP